MKKLLFFWILLVFVWCDFCFAQNFSDFKRFYLEEAQGFESFKNKQNKEFSAYIKELNKEFAEYKRIYQEEFEKYKKELSKFWENPEFPTKKRWVEYSSDLKARRSVDFKSGEIEISVIAPSKAQAEARIKKELITLLLENKQIAYKNDKVMQGVEKRLKKFKYVKEGKIDKEPIVSDLIFKKTPSLKQVEKYSEKTLNKAHLIVNKSKVKGTRVYTIRIKFPKKNIFRKAVRYVNYVLKYSAKYRLEPALVFAIIHTESSFNPLARSPIPAYGLMQIVPETAGRDATKIIYGKPVLLAPSFLYNGERNILVGTSYFYILYYKYFGRIKNPLSRLYCSIAAYNTGIGNVAKAVAGTTNLKKAIKKINQMSSHDVYKALIKRTSFETRNYLKKILKRRKMYAKVKF